MKKLLIILTLLMLIFYVAGCAKPAPVEKVAEEVKAPAETPAEVSTETAVEEVSQDISEVSEIEEDLGTDDLDALDKDLADLSW